MALLEVDLTPADMKIIVLEGEPSSIVFPITINGEDVDVATEFPNLVSRTRVSEESVLESPVTYSGPSEIVVVIPPLTYSRTEKVYWELRDSDADKTWITAPVKVERDRV